MQSPISVTVRLVVPPSFRFPQTPSAPLRAWVVHAVLVTAAALGAMPRDGKALRSTPMPGPWPVRPLGVLPSPVQINQTCEGCHVEIASEWRDSLHARAYTDAAFQRALQLEPLPFCRGCHAPESNPVGAGDPALQALGIGCVTCHVVSGEVLAAPSERAGFERAGTERGARDEATPEPGRRDPPRGHAVLRSATFATSAACAGCHEFEFPGQVATAPHDLMQSTRSEHAQSSHAETPCSSCHMPRTKGGHKSHRFDVSRNAALLQSAVYVEVRRLDPQRVEFRLTPRAVGHRFPTGDLFRRVRVEAEVVGPEFSSVAHAETFLTRRFVNTRTSAGALQRALSSDTRLLPDETRTIVLELGPAAAARPVDYAVTYERVAHPDESARSGALIEGSIELAAGQLPPLH